MKNKKSSIGTGYLSLFLSDERAARWLGRTAMFRLEILAAVVTGKPSLAQCARKYRVSRQSAHKCARRTVSMLSRPTVTRQLTESHS